MPRPTTKITAKGLPAVLAFIVGAAGLLGALYVGLWFMLVGGIVQVVHGFQASPVSASDIAWGIVRAAFFESAWLIFMAGLALASGIIVLFGRAK